MSYVLSLVSFCEKRLLLTISDICLGIFELKKLVGLWGRDDLQLCELVGPQF